jgi:hypothetical protein
LTTEIKSWACRRRSLIIKASGAEIYNSGRIVERIRGTGRLAVWQQKLKFCSRKRIYNFDELCTGRNFNLQAPGPPAQLAW